MRLATLALAVASTVALIGCEKEKVVDIEAPGVDIEVDEDGKTRVGSDD